MAVDTVQEHKLSYIFLLIFPTCASWPSSLITWLTLKLNANLLRKSHYYANIIGNTFSRSSSNSQQNFFKARNSYLYKEVNTKVRKVRKVDKKYCMKTTINFGHRIQIVSLSHCSFSLLFQLYSLYFMTVSLSWLCTEQGAELCGKIRSKTLVLPDGEMELFLPRLNFRFPDCWFPFPSLHGCKQLWVRLGGA